MSDPQACMTIIELRAEIERLTERNKHLEARFGYLEGDWDRRNHIIERLTARLIAESGEVEDLVNRLQESEDDNGRLMKRIATIRIAKLEADLRGAYNQGFSDGFDSKDKTFKWCIGAAADIGFSRFMSLDNSEVAK